MRGTPKTISRRAIASLRYPDTFANLLFLISAIWLSVSFLLIAAKPQPSHALALGQQMTVNEATLLRNYTVEYPIFHDQNLDGSIARYVSAQIDKFEKGVTNRNDVRNRLDISYAFLQFGKRSVSIKFTTKIKHVGKPDAFTRHYMVLDLVEKREIVSRDILKQDADARILLAKLLHDYFKRQPSIPLSSAELVGLLEMSPSDITQVYPQANDAVLSINPHLPTSQNGKVYVTINKDLLKGIINDAYLADVHTIAPVAPLKAEYQITERPLPGDIIDPAGKMLALTFDDGPSAMTNRIVDQLDKYQSHATFFVLGYAASSHKSELNYILREGSEIGNHSWNHADLRFQSIAELDYQILMTQQAIQEATGGHVPRLMRPPYGATNPAVHDYLVSHGFTQALWNVDTEDWRDRDAELIYQRIMASARDGAIVLLHDIHPTSVEAAIRAIRDLKAQGYQLVTLSQMYQYK